MCAHQGTFRKDMLWIFIMEIIVNISFKWCAGIIVVNIQFKKKKIYKRSSVYFKLDVWIYEFMKFYFHCQVAVPLIYTLHLILFILKFVGLKILNVSLHLGRSVYISFGNFLLLSLFVEGQSWTKRKEYLIKDIKKLFKQYSI